MKQLTTRQFPLLPRWCTSFDEQTSAEEVLMQRRLAQDGRLVMVMPRAKGITLAIGMPYPFHHIGVFADTWDYTNDTMAYYAYQSWDPTREKEPIGWSHHAASGRYRIEGDPELEYVQSEGTIQEQVIHALIMSMHQSHHIQSIEEIPLDYPTIFPLGTKCFVAYAESDDCPHTPKCQPTYTVLFSCGRCVVLTLSQVLLFEQEKILQRLRWEVYE